MNTMDKEGIVTILSWLLVIPSACLLYSVIEFTEVKTEMSYKMVGVTWITLVAVLMISIYSTVISKKVEMEARKYLKNVKALNEYIERSLRVLWILTALNVAISPLGIIVGYVYGRWDLSATYYLFTYFDIWRVWSGILPRIGYEG